MDFDEAMQVLRIVLGDNYLVFDTFDARDDSYTLRIERKWEWVGEWHLTMRFSSTEIMRMGKSFVGAVCRQVDTEYCEYVMRGVPE